MGRIKEHTGDYEPLTECNECNKCGSHDTVYKQYTSFDYWFCRKCKDETTVTFKMIGGAQIGPWTEYQPTFTSLGKDTHSPLNGKQSFTVTKTVNIVRKQS